MIEKRDQESLACSGGLLPRSFPVFIKPYTAVKRLAHYCGGSYNAKLLIADQIRDGEIRAYAKSSWISDEPNLKSSSREPAEGVERKILIPRSRLIAAQSWTENVAQWKWRAGDFFSVIRSKPMRRRHFSSVLFAKDDVERILLNVEEAHKKKLSTRGRPTKLDAWNKVWREVLRLAHSRGLNREAVGDMQSFRRLVMDAASKPGKDPPLDDETVAPLLNSIYREFVDPSAI